MSRIITFTSFTLAELVLTNMGLILDEDNPSDIYIANRVDGGIGLHATVSGGQRVATFGGNRTAIEQIDVNLIWMDGSPFERKIEAYFPAANAFQAAQVVCSWLIHGQTPGVGTF